MPAPRAAWPWRWIPPVLVATVTVVAFLPILENGFVDFDDDDLLVRNEHFRGFSPAHLRWMFSSVTLGHWQPLTWLSYAVDHRLWGMDAAGYHLTSLLLHTASAVVLYGVLLVLVTRAVSRPIADAPLRVGAAIAALTWSIHPLRVESVAWATERRDVLSGLFWLLTIAAYLRATSTAASAHRIGALVLAVTCCALSLLAKSWGMTLFAVLLVLDAYPLRRWRHDTSRRILLEKLPFAVLGVATSVVVWRGVRDYMPGVEAHGVGERLAQASYGLCFYLWKTIDPRALVPMYEFRTALDPLAPPYVFCLAAVVAGTALLVRLRRRWPGGLAAWTAYAIILSPVLGLTQAGPQLAADRYAYLAMLPWTAVLAGGVYRLASAPVPRSVSIAGALGSAALLLALAAATTRQARVWHTTETLWTHTVAVAPDNAFARANLAGVLLRAGRPAEAVAQVNALAALVDAAPGHRAAALQLGVAQGSLALLALQEGRVRDAVVLLERAVANNPNDARLRLTLAVALLDGGDVEGSMTQYRAALGLSRIDGETRGAMAVKLLEKDRGREAEEVLRPAVAATPDDPTLRINLGVALWQQGRRADALAAWREVLRRDPANRDARDLLDRVAAAGGD